MFIMDTDLRILESFSVPDQSLMVKNLVPAMNFELTVQSRGVSSKIGWVQKRKT